jgi:hypothetical protein
MLLTDIHASYGSQATSIAPTALSFTFGIGGRLPPPKLPDLRPWTPRDWAIAIFLLLGEARHQQAATLLAPLIEPLPSS